MGYKSNSLIYKKTREVREDEWKREQVKFDVGRIVIKRKLKFSDAQDIIFLKAFISYGS